jgi:hypothetical protein
MIATRIGGIPQSLRDRMGDAVNNVSQPKGLICARTRPRPMMLIVESNRWDGPVPRDAGGGSEPSLPAPPLTAGTLTVWTIDKQKVIFARHGYAHSPFA